MIVKLKWITPDADEMIAEIARVSNPSGPRKRSNSDLIAYLIKHRHWSPFEMANICVEVQTTRDIGRQMLRHRSVSFQEFSQRYADPDDLGQPIMREPRLQHPTNRQASVPLDDLAIEHNWYARQRELWNHARETYEWARENGFAK
ncbi:MAG: FAD-dependent thymidylate synthase, partial [Pseudomonadota bacterium]